MYSLRSLVGGYYYCILWRARCGGESSGIGGLEGSSLFTLIVAYSTSICIIGGGMKLKEWECFCRRCQCQGGTVFWTEGGVTCVFRGATWSRREVVYIDFRRGEASLARKKGGVQREKNQGKQNKQAQDGMARYSVTNSENH